MTFVPSEMRRGTMSACPSAIIEGIHSTVTKPPLKMTSAFTSSASRREPRDFHPYQRFPVGLAPLSAAQEDNLVSQCDERFGHPPDPGITPAVRVGQAPAIDLQHYGKLREHARHYPVLHDSVRGSRRPCFIGGSSARACIPCQSGLS